MGLKFPPHKEPRMTDEAKGRRQISQSSLKAADEAKEPGERHGQHARKLTSAHRRREPEKSSGDILKAEIFQFQNGKQLQFDCGLAGNGRAAQPEQSRRRKTCPILQIQSGASAARRAATPEQL